MASAGELSAAHVVLLATQLCSDASIDAFRALRSHYSEVFSAEVFYRIILTFLPEETDPAIYVPVLRDLLNGNGNFSTDFDISSVLALSESSAQAQVQKLHFQRILPSDSRSNAERDLLSNFLVQRAHQIDASTNDLLAILQLLEPFVDDHSESLRKWLISILLPLLRKDYEYYPG